MIRDEARQVALMQAIHTDEQHMVDARLLGADGWGQESCGQRHRDHDSGEGLHATSGWKNRGRELSARGGGVGADAVKLA